MIGEKDDALDDFALDVMRAALLDSYNSVSKEKPGTFHTYTYELTVTLSRDGNKVFMQGPTLKRKK